MNSRLKIATAVISLVLVLWHLSAAENGEEVKFIAELPTPGEYTLFANGGWDGNWFVGYKHRWVSELPPVTDNWYAGVYLGAKLGRALTAEQIREIKTKRTGKQNPDTGPYRILIGISDSPGQKPTVSKLLVMTDNIPLEGSGMSAVEGISDSRWFWVKVDKSMLITDKPNYVHVWSDDEGLDASDVAPVLAGGLGSNKNTNSYLVKGEKEDEIRNIKYFEPAIAIKLVGKNPPRPDIDITAFEQHPVRPQRYLVRTSVTGRRIMEVWVQIFDGSEWKDTGWPVTRPPYDIVFDYSKLPPGGYRLRCRVENWWGEVSYTAMREFRIENEEKAAK
ncbi:MAG: hypothetical protein ABIH89_04010 [Elusimicrobiota bacterium]